MKIPSQAITFPTFLGGMELSDVAGILNLIPQPCFLIDSNSGKIRSANSAAIEMTHYSQEELSNFPLSRLLPDHNQDIANYDEQTQPHTILMADKTPIEGIAQIQFLSEKSKWAVLTFTPLSNMTSTISRALAEQTLQQIFEWFVFTYQENQPIGVLLTRSLEIFTQITGFQNAYVYFTLPNKTKLSRIAFHGDEPFLPEVLPVNTLMNHLDIEIITADESSSDALARSAASHQQQTIVSIPLGEENARIGLLLLTGQVRGRTNLSLELYEHFGKVVSSIIQFQNQIRVLSHDLSLQTRENQIHRLIEKEIQQGIIIFANDQRILHINSAAETILGYTLSEVQNKPLSNFIISESDLSPYIQSALNGKMTKPIPTVRLYRRSGQSFLAELAILPFNVDPKGNGAVILIQDRTEQETLLKQTMRLEQRAILGGFTAIFAHEVRNPINNIYSNLQNMAETLSPDDPFQATINRAMQNCVRLNELMESILSYNRMSEKPMETLELSSLIKRILDRNMAKLKLANIHVDYQAEPSLPTIKGNRQALEHVFANLIDNAMQVMKENGGNLTVKVHRFSDVEAKPMLEVSIADSGPGIASEYKDKILRQSFTTKSDGTGMGLMISNSIIQAHHGWIDFDSIPGGTVFYVRLPVENTTQ